MISKKITTPIADVSWIGELPIIQKVFDSGGDSVDNVYTHLKMVRENFIQPEQKILVLADIRASKKVGKNARDTIVREGFETYDAVAILVGSPLSRIIGTLAIKFNKPKTKVKIFLDEHQAVDWLKSFL